MSNDGKAKVQRIEQSNETDAASDAGKPETPEARPDKRGREHGGPAGPEPTRYGDWEKGGRCIDF